MDKNAIWKWLILLLMLAVSLALVYPPAEKVQLGLDLKGGVSFTVEMDQEEIKRRLLESDPNLTPEQLAAEISRTARSARENALEVIRNRVDGLGIAEPVIYAASYQGHERIVVQLPGISEERSADARASIESVAFLEFRMVAERSETWTKSLLAQAKAPRGFKISEKGDNYVRDVSAVKDEQMDRAYYAELRKFEYRPGCEFFLERDTDAAGRTIYRPYYVEVRRQMTGESIKNAGVDYHPTTGAPYVTLEFDAKGAKKFANITANYAPRGEMNKNRDTGRQLAIILDGTLYSAPAIREEIPNGRATITGQFRVPEAMRLANVLRAGSLPAPVTIVETRTVDPTLGADSIRSGKVAAVVGVAAVFLFMVIYYRMAGAVADFALVIELLLLPLGLIVVSGFFSMISGGAKTASGIMELPTLTLPGVAGIVLTVGMAVDANVLIYERIREELNSGKRLVSAVAAGYEKAWSTIFDSNITTLLAAVILFYFGSGPVRGFAITLSAGILVSMMVAVVYTRLGFEFMISRFKLGNLKMMAFFKKANINFLRIKNLTLGLSLLVIVITWVFFFMRGQENLGIDFVGGAAMQVQFDKRLSADEVRSRLKAQGLDAEIQFQMELAPDSTGMRREFLDVRAAEKYADKIKSCLTTDFKDAGFKVVKEDVVGGQMGSELRRKAIIGLIWAWVGMIIYISIRFQFAFAVGAIVALIHDVLITVGVFCLLGRQLSMPIVAALLTIVGYSVNDTIVVFDRIREDLKLYRDKPYRDICNLSINQTLSRTILTSLTTLCTVVSLLVFGGGAIFDFALALFIGITIGTYSSIYIATPIMLFLHPEKRARR